MDRLLLIRKIAEEFSINDETASEFVQNIFDTILKALYSGKNVNIADFGKFIIKNNKISFSPVKRFAQEINYNYVGLESIKIRNYNEKEFREKVNRLKKIEEEIEIQLSGISSDTVEEKIRLPEPPLPEKQEIKIEKQIIPDDIFIKEQLPEEKEEKEEKISEDYIFNNIIPETGVPKEENVTEEDIDEAVNSAVEEFLKLNFPGKEEKIPPPKTELAKKIEEKVRENISRTVSGLLPEDKISTEEVLKDPKEFKPFISSFVKPVLEDFSDFITHKEPYRKEEEIKNINQIIKEPEAKKKDITEEPVNPLEDITKFIIVPTAEPGEKIKEIKDEAEGLDEIENIEALTDERITDDLNIAGFTDEVEEKFEELIPEKTEEIVEQPEEITEVMKDVEDKLSHRIEEAKAYKNKVFNEDKLADLIAQREQIIRDIKLTSDYTIEPFRFDEPEVSEEPHEEMEKEEMKTEDFKSFLIPSTETGQQEPVKYTDIPDKKKSSEPNIDDIIQEREKIIREIEKASGYTAETYKTKEPLKFPPENKTEKTSPEFDNFLIPPPKIEPQENIVTPEITEKTEKRALTYDEILEERRKFLEQEYKSPEMTVFDSNNKDTRKENEIDEYLSRLDKIKDNLKTEEPGFKDYIIPESNIPTEELMEHDRELISGDVKGLHDDIIKPVEESIPEKIKNFNDIFIEDNKVIFYNTKETKATEEMYKKANLKSYDDVFFRFDSDKKLKKSETKKETNFLVVGLIWFVIIAAVLTILAVIFR